MALNGALVITASKIMDGKKQSYLYSGPGKDIAIITANVLRVVPTGADDEDSLYIMNDGTLIWGIADFDDTTNVLSASDQTGS